MGDDSEAMARMAAENEDDDLDMDVLLQRLQEANRAAQGSGAGAQPLLPVRQETKKTGNVGLHHLVRSIPPRPPSMDDASKKGQFRWFAIHGVMLPYILRSDVFYIPLKMIERSVFGELIGEIPKEAVECAKVDAVYVSEAEAKLLNEINMKHCEGVFGKEMFSQRDKMVGKEGLESFLAFLLFLRQSLVQGEKPGEGARCGVIKIKAEGETSYLPFTLLGKSRWVPLSYFEGDVDDLKAGSKSIRGWELAYLRVAARMLGLGEGREGGLRALEANTASVVRLDTILSCYPSKPKTEEVWHPKAVMARAQSPVSAVWTVMCQSGPRRKYAAGKLTLIKEFASIGSGPNYKFLPAQIEGTKLMGINVKPRQWHDLLLPLPDLVSSLVPKLSVEEAGEFLAGKGTNLFRGNQGQSDVLETEGKAAQWDPTPLVRMADAKKHLAALKAEEAAREAAKKRKWMDSDSDSD